MVHKCFHNCVHLLRIRKKNKEQVHHSSQSFRFEHSFWFNQMGSVEQYVRTNLWFSNPETCKMQVHHPKQSNFPIELGERMGQDKGIGANQL